MSWFRYVQAGLAAYLVLLPLGALAQNARPIRVLAAASLTDVLSGIGKSYEAATGRKVVFSFAGSMILAKQIEASSGADMFISADTESMDYLESRKLIASGSRTDLFGNTLVLVAPANSRVALSVAPGMPLAAALQGGRLALANLDTVPAGRYARAALMALGVFDSVKNRLAQGEDVRGALAYVARGEAPLGIVYATDARIEPKVRVVAIFPASTHEPIVYPVALTRDGRPEAAQFLAYLKGPEARAAFEHAGFVAPSLR